MGPPVAISSLAINYFVADSLVIHCGFVAGSLHIHCGFVAGSLHIHCGFVAGSLQVHCTLIAGSLQGGVGPAMQSIFGSRPTRRCWQGTAERVTFLF
jgi:hypothetical protein